MRSESGTAQGRNARTWTSALLRPGYIIVCDDGGLLSRLEAAVVAHVSRVQVHVLQDRDEGRRFAII
jgi:hypothetical protein